ncbi:MAG: DUF1211 domain-containing protein [Proteobacteria bacterium]|nr:DUF1211 domain-containing protein [Pseudomonadota bacterium]
MTTARLEAFSDGVMAILITIMVLELKVPHDVTIAALRDMTPQLLSYVLSFVYLGIYWNNHHHLFHVVERVSGAIMWANLHLLFWLSLVPFVTAWMGENQFAPLPTACYGVALFMSAIAYTILVRAIIGHHGRDSKAARAIGNDLKGYASLALYAAAIPLAFVHTGIADALYLSVAVIWLVPDRRIERQLAADAKH